MNSFIGTYSNSNEEKDPDVLEEHRKGLVDVLKGLHLEPYDSNDPELEGVKTVYRYRDPNPIKNVHNVVDDMFLLHTSFERESKKWNVFGIVGRKESGIYDVLEAIKAFYDETKIYETEEEITVKQEKEMPVSQ